MENTDPGLTLTGNVTSLTAILPISLICAPTSAGWSSVHDVESRPDHSSLSRAVLQCLNMATHSYIFFCAIHCSPYCANNLLLISDVLTPSNHKKQIIAIFHIMVQVESGAANFQENL